MRIVFVHGWSVTSTDTYGGLPEALANHAPPGLELAIGHLHLARYVSFADEVTMDDLARGMEAAVCAEVLPLLARGERFAAVTHSTGGPLVRSWIELFHGEALAKCPLSHLVMLAPANHGSALAQLGKSRLARMKFFAGGFEPGVRILDWLELGSDEGWRLNGAWFERSFVEAGLYTFVLTGQSIDRTFYDALNSYTGEAGSDGVVRAAAANLNYGVIRLEQGVDGIQLRREGQSPASAFAILPGLSHSGELMGILRSVEADSSAGHPTVAGVLACLGVTSAQKYRACIKAFAAITAETQDAERKTNEKSLFLFRRQFVVSRYC
ncbi:MAG: phospholipase, partial [Proteobacteria bacterium]